jgi:hypothetical protein
LLLDRFELLVAASMAFARADESVDGVVWATTVS